MISKFSNDQLLERAKHVARREQKWNALLLLHLKEIYVRKLHLKRGYDSLRRYCMEELGYDEKGSSMRESAVRLLVDLPEAVERVAAGELSLTRASTLGSFLRKEEVLRRSQGEVLPRMEKVKLLEVSATQTLSEVNRTFAQTTIAPEPRRVECERYARDGRRKFIQFEAGEELQAKIDRVKVLMSHTNPAMSTQVMIERLCDFYLAKKDPVRELRSEKLGKNRALKSNLSQLPRNARTANTALKKTLWTRDDQGCVYRDTKTGRRCGSKHKLQVEHRIPYAIGGQTTEENCRLMCAAHNALLAEEMGLLRKP